MIIIEYQLRGPFEGYLNPIIILKKKSSFLKKTRYINKRLNKVSLLFFIYVTIKLTLLFCILSNLKGQAVQHHLFMPINYFTVIANNIYINEY